jgi:hypothetical protein
MSSTRPLKSEQRVTSADGRRLGEIRTILRRDVYRVRWEDGTESAEKREDLLVRYTSTTPTRTDAAGKVHATIAKGRISPHVAGLPEPRKAAEKAAA